MSEERHEVPIGWNIYGFLLLCTIVFGVMLIFAAGVVVGTRWGRSPIHIEHMHSEAPFLPSMDLPVNTNEIRKEVLPNSKSRTKK